jgi:hypothetical protein
MAMIRLKPFTTATTAPGTAGGLLTVADTSGLTRHCHISIGTVAAFAGLRCEVVLVVDATHVVARLANSMEYAGVFNKNDLSAVPAAAPITLEEQWVPDLYQDDVPDNLSIPTK